VRLGLPAEIEMPTGIMSAQPGKSVADGPAQGTGFPLQLLKTPCVISPALMEEMRMKKALAVLATIATVAATTVTAPAQARGLGPGLAFGLAAGAIVAGAAASSYGYYGPGMAMVTTARVTMDRPTTRRTTDPDRTLITADRIIGTATGATGNQKARSMAPGFLLPRSKTEKAREAPPYDQNTGRSNPLRTFSCRAFSSVVTKYSSRSRSNLACVALKLAMRVMISSRSKRRCLAVRSCPSL